MPQSLPKRETHRQVLIKCLAVVLAIISLASSAHSSAPKYLSEQTLQADNVSLIQTARYEPIAAIVTSQKANLRETPFGAVIRTLNNGDLLTLLDATPIGPWYQVRDNKCESEGWIHGNTIALLQTTESSSASKIASQKPRLVSPRVSRRSYVNVDGVRVPSPVFSETKPAGATARCRDGSYSFSQHRRGTCSHHGGVAEWF